MDFNKRIASNIIADLNKAKQHEISITTLELNLRKNLDALDSTFPVELRSTIEDLFDKISDHQQNQYSSTLNTSNEGTYGESLPIGNLFDSEITMLNDFIKVPNT